MKGQLSGGSRKPDVLHFLSEADKEGTFKRWGKERSREERRECLQVVGAGLKSKLCASEQRLSYGLLTDEIDHLK